MIMALTIRLSQEFSLADLLNSFFPFLNSNSDQQFFRQRELLSVHILHELLSFVMCACAFGVVERLVGAVNTIALEKSASSDFDLTL